MIYVIFRCKKGGNESALSANYLQGDTRLCKHPEMGHELRWGTGTQKPCCLLARSGTSEAPNDLGHGAREQTWAVHGIAWNALRWGLGGRIKWCFRTGVSMDYLCQRQWISLGDLRKVNLSGLSLCYLNLRVYLLRPPPGAVVNVMGLQVPEWIIHLWGTRLFLLQPKMGDEGQQLSSHLQKVPPPVRSAAARGAIPASPGRVPKQGKEERAQAVSGDSCSSFANHPSFPWREMCQILRWFNLL